MHRRSMAAWAAYKVRLASKAAIAAVTRERRLTASGFHRSAIAIAVTTAVKEARNHGLSGATATLPATTATNTPAKSQFCRFLTGPGGRF